MNESKEYTTPMRSVNVEEHRTKHGRYAYKSALEDAATKLRYAEAELAILRQRVGLLPEFFYTVAQAVRGF